MCFLHTGYNFIFLKYPTVSLTPSVIRTHASAIGIEDAHDPRIHPMIAVIRHRNSLSIPLRLIVHSARSDQVYIAPVGSRLRVHKQVAVYLGYGCKLKARPLLLGKTQHVIGTKCPDLKRLDGQVKIVYR